MPPIRVHPAKPELLKTDVLLPIQEKPYMDQILSGSKNYEFRKYLIKPSVKRIWFYLNAPSSSIKYICEISPARTRNKGDPPLDENGIGNKEFNQRHKDWDGYDYAYEIASVRELLEPISLADMKRKYKMKGAPRGLVYVPGDILEAVPWVQQDKLR